MHCSYPGQAPDSRTWADIYLGRLEANYHTLRAALPRQKFLGVVKANAYGHGAIPVARRLEALDADYLAVACLDEAMELRQAGIRLPLLILGYTDPRYAPLLAEQDLTQTIYDTGLAAALSAALLPGQRLRCHLKLDTGMSRLGFYCGEGADFAPIAALNKLPGLEFEGVFTHFSDADGSDEYTRWQLRRFQAAIDTLAASGMTFALRHCAASAAALNYPDEAGFDMVRPGILLYGHHPDESTRALLNVQPVMELKTRIVSLKDLPAGTCISYGRTYTLPAARRIAAVPVGYGDGLMRLLSGRQDMLLHGRRVPQIGRVCMDMCMLDVTDCPAAIGDEVTVFGAALPLEEKATAIGTIPYELLCAINPRVPRVYHN